MFSFRHGFRFRLPIGFGLSYTFYIPIPGFSQKIRKEPLVEKITQIDAEINQFKNKRLDSFVKIDSEDNRPSELESTIEKFNNLSILETAELIIKTANDVKFKISQNSLSALEGGVVDWEIQTEIFYRIIYETSLKVSHVDNWEELPSQESKRVLKVATVLADFMENYQNQALIKPNWKKVIFRIKSDLDKLDLSEINTEFYEK